MIAHLGTFRKQPVLFVPLGRRVICEVGMEILAYVVLIYFMWIVVVATIKLKEALQCGMPVS